MRWRQLQASVVTLHARLPLQWRHLVHWTGRHTSAVSKETENALLKAIEDLRFLDNTSGALALSDCLLRQSPPWHALVSPAWRPCGACRASRRGMGPEKRHAHC